MAAYQVSYTREAISDIEEAARWYDRQRKGLGSKFLNSLRSGQRMIRKNPFAFALKYDEVRCIPVSRFPFPVHYKIYPGEKKIIVFAVFHTSMDPGKLLH